MKLGNLDISNVYVGGTECTSIYLGSECIWGLPKEYTKLEYIQSTGTQYINTGYTPNSNSKMWLDYQPTSAQSAMYAGARIATNQNAFTINSGSNGTKMYAAWGTSGNLVLDNMTTSRCITQIGQDGIYYNGNLINSPSTQTWSITQRVLLFAVMQGSDSITLQSSCKIYGCKIYENDELQMDFIPCKRNSDNVLGMYDTVSQTFLTNAGTGTFVAPS